MESKRSLGSVSDGTGYDAIPSDSEPSPEILSELKELLHDAFRAYDSDGNGTLEKHEIRVFLKDFHENIDEDTVDKICARVDVDNDNLISLDEFVLLCYYLIMSDDDHSMKSAPVVDNGFRASIQAHVFKDDDGEGDDDEVEDIPEDFTDLSPEDQQAAIKLRAFKMLFVGTLMVVYFSDPMVDVMQEIAQMQHPTILCYFRPCTLSIEFKRSYCQYVLCSKEDPKDYDCFSFCAGRCGMYE